MRVSTSIILILALILSIVDGVATYIEITNDWAIEINPIPKLIQTKYGMENWLMFHIIIVTIWALILAIVWQKPFSLTKNLYLERIFWPVYLWLVIELFLLIIHIRIFLLAKQGGAL